MGSGEEMLGRQAEHLDWERMRETRICPNCWLHRASTSNVTRLVGFTGVEDMIAPIIALAQEPESE